MTIVNVTIKIIKHKNNTKPTTFLKYKNIAIRGELIFANNVENI